MAARREPRPRQGGSDLPGRVLAALLAAPVAIVLVWQGGEVFALGLLVLGVIALGELYGLMERVRPPALAGFLTLAALLAAALYGEPRHVVMVLVAAFPVTFLLALMRPAPRERVVGDRRDDVRGALDRAGDGARDLAARAVVRAGREDDRDRHGAGLRRADRHLHRRHVRLLRRPRVRPHRSSRR